MDRAAGTEPRQAGAARASPDRVEQKHVLLVEDDRSLANLIVRGLETEDLDVTTTDSSIDAIMRLQRTRFDVLLLDIMLNGSSGIYVVDALRDLPAEERPRVVIITGARGNILTNIDRTIVKAVVFKPLDVSSLSAYVRALA